jgi:hypothetical protein
MFLSLRNVLPERMELFVSTVCSSMRPGSTFRKLNITGGSCIRNQFYRCHQRAAFLSDISVCDSGLDEMQIAQSASLAVHVLAKVGTIVADLRRSVLRVWLVTK